MCVKLCVFPDRSLRGRGSGPTEAGSALGPDWHEGIILQGAEEVRLCVLMNACVLISTGLVSLFMWESTTANKPVSLS